MFTSNKLYKAFLCALVPFAGGIWLFTSFVAHLCSPHLRRVRDVVG